LHFIANKLETDRHIPRNRVHGYAVGGCSYFVAPKEEEEEVITIAMKIKISRTKCEEDQGKEEEDEE